MLLLSHLLNLCYYAPALSDGKLSLTPTEAAYLAGIIDGEGSFILEFSKNGRQPSNSYQWRIRISVQSTSYELIHWLHEKIPGNYNTSIPKNKLWSQTYTWEIRNLKAKATNQIIKPYLITKARHTELLEQYFKTVTKPGVRLTASLVLKRVEILKQLWALNTRGTRKPHTTLSRIRDFYQIKHNITAGYED